ncbi:MAG: LPS assembly protein LptD [Planctomycetes bacterium]|nr:LPS assembly protein LptD [Planctomycetota bacterium]
MGRCFALLGLLLVLAAAGAGLHAQAGRLPGEIEIQFVVEEDQQTYWEIWREGDNGPFVLALPYAVRLEYRELTPGRQGLAPVEKSLELLADRALIWFEPNPGETADTRADIESDPFLALSRGAAKFQFYGEGNVWLRYAVDGESITMRADRTYLDFASSRIVTMDDKGKQRESQQLNLRGRLDNVKAHSGAGRPLVKPTDEGVPMKAGVGVGGSGDEAAEEKREDRVGAAPSDDGVPVPAGTPRSLPQEQGVRLFMRARELRLIGLTPEEQEVELLDGSISSSSLAVASYSLAADVLTVRLTRVRQTVYLTRPAVRLLDFPLLVLPLQDYAYDLDSEPPIRQLDLGHSSQYGYWFRTYVDAIATYDFFADPEPVFKPLQLGPQLDYFSRRGFGSGLNLDWGGLRAFEPFGRAGMRSYYINDPGDKRGRAGELGWYPVEKHSRGRFLSMYSQNFGANWQLDSIFSYDSDRNFRREFYQREHDNNEPRDSFILLSKREHDLAYYLLLAPKVHPWQSRTEYLPTLGFDASHVAIADFGLRINSHTEASILNFRPGDGDTRQQVYTGRADSSTWFNLPLDLGVLALDPYAGARVTVARDHIKMPEDMSRPGLSPDGTFPGLAPGQQIQGGLLYRVLPFFGVNAQTFITGTFPDCRVPALGIDGLRHVFAPFVRYRNIAYNSLDDVPGRAFIPFDDVDVLDEYHEVRVGFRNRLQTRQGSGRERRTVDYFEVMVELPIFPNRRRDNNDRWAGDLEVAALWRPAPGFALSGQMFLDPLSGNFNRASASFRFDILNLGQANVYYRLLKGQHQVVGVQLDLALSELYRVGAKQEYDMQNGEFRDTRIELTRRVLEIFDLGMVFTYDAVENNFGFYVSFGAAFQAPKGSSGLLR